MVRKFLGYVEIKTKTASLLPFLLGLLYALYAFRRLAVLPTAVYFVTMLVFDMSVTALNNYQDTKTDGTPLQFSRKASKRILYALWTVAVLGGLALAFLGGLVVLVCGALCFTVGILYSFGPAPIARLPLGEAFSGVMMGFFIPFLVIYINAPAQGLVWYDYTAPVLTVGADIAALFRLAVLTAPPILTIAGIMLANNICDVQNDTKIGRFTLPYYTGRKNALRLFALLYIAAYASVVAAALFGVLPVYVLVVLAGIPLVWRNVRRFSAMPVKKETFALSITSFLVITAPLALVTAAGLLLQPGGIYVV